MEFGFSEAQEKMRRELPQLIEERKKIAKEQGTSTMDFALDLYKKIGEHGWIGIFIPKEYGGSAGTLLDFGVYLEALHYFRAPEVTRTWTDINIIIMSAILTYGSEEAKRKFLPPICTGDIRSSICWTEPDGGADAYAHKVRAIKKDDHYLVDGTKIYNESHRCTHTLAFVKTSMGQPRGSGHSSIMIDLSSPGITMSPLWMQWGLRRDETVFDEVKVPQENLIGTEGMGWDYWYNGVISVEWATLGNTGLLKRDFEMFVEQAKQIQRDGKALTDIPSVRDALAELALELEIGRNLYYRAWSTPKNGLLDIPTSAVTKIYTTELWQKL